MLSIVSHKAYTMSDDVREVDGLAKPRRWYRRRTLLVVASVAVFGGLLASFGVAIGRAREAAARSSCNLGSIKMALHYYHDFYGTLPPAIVCDADGKPLHSWRVLILPYLDEQKLYEEFRLDEPWNSAHNLPLLKQMPRSYEPPWTYHVDVPPSHTVIRVLHGPGAAFEGREGLRFPEDFPDGWEHTLLFVEAGEPVPWTKPEGISYDPTQPVRLQGLFRDGYRTIIDGYRFIRHDADPEFVHAVITRNGGEELPAGW